MSTRLLHSNSADRASTNLPPPRIYTDDELAAAARQVNELCNQLLHEFRPIQAEAYASYCEREALVAAEAGRR